jgi:hypothetical protein
VWSGGDVRPLRLVLGPAAGYAVNRVARSNTAGRTLAPPVSVEISPAYVLAGQWAGLEPEAEMLRKEIGRLRSLCSNAAHDLEDAGQERKAARLLRALEGR